MPNPEPTPKIPWIIKHQSTIDRWVYALTLVWIGVWTVVILADILLHQNLTKDIFILILLITIVTMQTRINLLTHRETPHVTIQIDPQGIIRGQVMENGQIRNIPISKKNES